MLIAIAIVMFIVVVASTWWFGLWSNLVTLINLLLAAMLASSIYTPVANEMGGINLTYLYLYDFLAAWVVFVIAFVLLRMATDTLSAYRLKFDPVTEIIGRSILSIWIAGVFICFTFFTLQMAPLPPNVYKETNVPAEMGTYPDRLWLAFIQSRSRGALSAGTAKGLWPEYRLRPHPDDVDLNVRVFDPEAQFLPFYAGRRQEISKRKTIRILPGE